MEKKNKKRVAPDKKLAGVCGVFCPSCTIYIGTHDDPGRLQFMGHRFERPVEDLLCNGCRSDKRSFHCQACTFISCATEKGIDFCRECKEYPCESLTKFQAEMPHRLELWEHHRRMQEVGFEQWFTELLDHYACPQCQTINSAYDISCRSCKTMPSCSYVEAHQETMTVFVKSRIQE